MFKFFIFIDPARWRKGKFALYFKLDEKGIRNHYLDMLEMPHKTMTYLKMYCSSYPMVLSVNYFSNFNEILEQFNKIWIVFIYYIYIVIFFEKKKRIGRWRRWRLSTKVSIKKRLNMKFLGDSLLCLHLLYFTFSKN